MYEKQLRLRDELNDRFPRMRGNLGQQMFRSFYYNSRMHGESVSEAIRSSVEAIRHYVPGFTPTET
jgi:hypothetical protein